MLANITYRHAATLAVDTAIDTVETALYALTLTGLSAYAIGDDVQGHRTIGQNTDMQAALAALQKVQQDLITEEMVRN